MILNFEFSIVLNISYLFLSNHSFNSFLHEILLSLLYLSINSHMIIPNWVVSSFKYFLIKICVSELSLLIILSLFIIFVYSKQTLLIFNILLTIYIISMSIFNCRMCFSCSNDDRELFCIVMNVQTWILKFEKLIYFNLSPNKIYFFVWLLYNLPPESSSHYSFY